jgi:hypothetical protein
MTGERLGLFMERLARDEKDCERAVPRVEF